jgi:hypothetical protein
MHTEEPTTILKRDALGRVTVTRAQREALLEEFERSGLKGLPFAPDGGGQLPDLCLVGAKASAPAR